MADVTENLRLPSLAQVKALIKAITASDVGAVPLDGSAIMTGAIKFNKDYGRVYADTDRLQLESWGKQGSTNNRHVWRLNDTSVSLNNAFQLYRTTDGTWKSYNFFGEHNKPSGSYTGNGSATQRSITIQNCIGRMLLVFAYGEESGIDVASLVFFNGAFGINSSGIFTNFSMNQARFSFNGSNGGSLVIASNSDLLNKNGVTYHYIAI